MVKFKSYFLDFDKENNENSEKQKLNKKPKSKFASKNENEDKLLDILTEDAGTVEHFDQELNDSLISVEKIGSRLRNKILTKKLKGFAKEDLFLFNNINIANTENNKSNDENTYRNTISNLPKIKHFPKKYSKIVNEKFFNINFNKETLVKEKNEAIKQIENDLNNTSQIFNNQTFYNFKKINRTSVGFHERSLSNGATKANISAINKKVEKVLKK